MAETQVDGELVYTKRYVSSTPAPVYPKDTKQENMILQSFVRHMKDQYWAYIALSGFLIGYAGIVLAVFGFTAILVKSGPELGAFGIFLILGGIALVMTSGILYHRKMRRLRPCLCCGFDMDDGPEIPIRPKRRLRFAPNLISPYYQSAKEKELEQRTKRAEDTVVLETEAHGTDAYEGSCTSLITKDTTYAQATKC